MVLTVAGLLDTSVVIALAGPQPPELPVDGLVAVRYGQLVAAVRRAGRRLGVADA